MIRTALRPRFLALLALVLLVVLAFVRLGMWQLDVSKDDGAKEALAKAQSQPEVPLGDVIRPHSEFRGAMSNRKVTVHGSYDATGQFLVPERLLDGAPGYWVVTPLDESATKARVVVVRGFVTDPAQAGRPPATPTTVSGTLAPGESPSDAVLPAGQRGSIDLSLLVNEWHHDMYNAFVIAQGERPDLAAGTQLRRIPPPRPESQMNLRNFSYAIQWWIFAAFALWMWWRMVRDEHQAEQLAAPADPTDDPRPTDPAGGPAR